MKDMKGMQHKGKQAPAGTKVKKEGSKEACQGCR